jgi:IS30 family transposase
VFYYSIKTVVGEPKQKTSAIVLIDRKKGIAIINPSLKSADKVVNEFFKLVDDYIQKNLKYISFDNKMILNIKLNVDKYEICIT